MNAKLTSQPHLLVCSSLSRPSGARLRLVIASLLVLGFAIFAPTGLALAHTAPSAGRNATAERLTHSLVSLSAQYQLVDATEQPPLLSQLITVASARQRLLIRLIEDNPTEVLRLALPTAIRASLPPEVPAIVEDKAELRGVLEVLHEDHEKGGRNLYFLDIEGKRLSLHFADEPPALLTGSQVRVTGVRVKEALALASGGTSVRHCLRPCRTPSGRARPW